MTTSTTQRLRSRRSWSSNSIAVSRRIAIASAFERARARGAECGLLSCAVVGDLWQKLLAGSAYTESYREDRRVRLNRAS